MYTYTLQTENKLIGESPYPMIESTRTRVVESRDFLPITELFNIYKTQRLVAKRQANPETKRNNVLRLEQILKHYGINAEDHDIGQFRRVTAEGIPICEDWVARRGSNEMRQARSLFSKGWIQRYRQLGIDVSCFANWIALSLDGVQVTPFNADRRELRAITTKCQELKTRDKQMYLMYCLAFGLGLRSSEIQRAKFGDLHEDFDGNKLIRIHAPKSGGDFQDRPCDPAWWEEILSFKTSDDAFIVPCQEDRITREFPGFLRRRCGITDDRPVHRLRKYCGHRVMRDNGNNAFIAQRALGHSSVEMTARVYCGQPQIARSF